MACGLPVVASCVGGNPEWVHPGKNGYLFTSENADELCQYLTKLIEGKDQARKMGNYARNLVEQAGSMLRTSQQISEGLRSKLHAKS